MDTRWLVEFFKTVDGENPVMAFISSLPEEDQAKVFRVITLLSNLGILLRAPHTKALEGEKNLFELRIKQGSDIQRIFYFHYTGKTFVLLHGFTKKSQKTPAQEIKKAKARKQEYLQRQEVKPRA